MLVPPMDGTPEPCPIYARWTHTTNWGASLGSGRLQRTLLVNGAQGQLVRPDTGKPVLLRTSH